MEKEILRLLGEKDGEFYFTEGKRYGKTLRGL